MRTAVFDDGGQRARRAVVMERKVGHISEPSHTLPSGRRLRNRREFQHVFDTGRRSHGRYLTLVAAPSSGPSSRLGIVASRKLGGAVVRNRAKRLIREMFRNREDREGVDLVVIPKPALLEAPRQALEQDFESALRRFRSHSSSK